MANLLPLLNLIIFFIHSFESYNTLFFITILLCVYYKVLISTGLRAKKRQKNS